MFQKSRAHNLSYSVRIELTYHKVRTYKAHMVWEHWGWVPDMYSDSLHNSSCEHPGAVMNICVSLQKYSVKNNLVFTPFMLIEVVQLMKRIEFRNKIYIPLQFYQASTGIVLLAIQF